MNNLENIKNILTDFEVDYDHQDWIKLEKDLPKGSGISTLTKTIFIAAAVILTLSTIYILSSQKDLRESATKVSLNSTFNDFTVKNNSNSDDISVNNDQIATNDTNNNSENDIIIVEDDSENSENNTNQDTDENADLKSENVTNNASPENTNNENTENVNNNQDSYEETKPDLSKTKFNININDYCSPALATFEVHNLPEGCKIVWNTGDSYRVDGNNAEHIYYETGDFFPEVTVIYNNFVIKNDKLEMFTINSPTDTKINFDISENLYYFTCSIKEELEFLWTIDNQQFRERDVRYEFNKSAEYSINLSIVNEFGCKSTVSEKVKILIEHVFYLPNAFIPSSNGVNSNFGPIGEDMDFESYRLIIVDGNGNLVFESNNVDFTWNGKTNNIGEDAKPGYYLWEVKTMDSFGNVQTKKGRVSLIRN